MDIPVGGHFRWVVVCAQPYKSKLSEKFRLVYFQFAFDADVKTILQVHYGHVA